MVGKACRDIMTEASKYALSFFEKDQNSTILVLHTTAKMLDPVGMIAPFTVYPKYYSKSFANKVSLRMRVFNLISERNGDVDDGASRSLGALKT
ncbi:hypothetical protein HPB48_002568 [Haemaphysalis longicornis]|uniref:Uncharacterized protein n=1 Tax=Haemaphysalis longicornis TaxID=44386 RepID=A0A9J6GHV0_HAELO|nr:hypothetical protein HPB48_002568 [Haemaphysalis longicornis]